MYWYVHPKVLQYEQVKAEAGENLAEFCRDYTTNLLIPRKINGQLKKLKGE